MHTTWTNAMEAMAELGIDASYRQIDYWCAHGLLGDEKTRRGSGWRREFDRRDLELIDALCNVRKLTHSVDLAMVAEAVRSRPINAAGEVLVLEADGTARRHDHWCAVPHELTAGVCVIPLRSFAAVPPAGSDDGTTAEPNRPVVSGAAVTAAAAPPSHP